MYEKTLWKNYGASWDHEYMNVSLHHVVTKMSQMMLRIHETNLWAHIQTSTSTNWIYFNKSEVLKSNQLQICSLCSILSNEITCFETCQEMCVSDLIIWSIGSFVKSSTQWNLPKKKSKDLLFKLTADLM